MPVVAGHLAKLQTGLDFVNTLDLWPVPHDHLDSAESALDWLVEHDLLHREARAHLLATFATSPAAGAEILGKLRRVRQAMRGVLEAAAVQRAPEAADLEEMNRALRTHYIYELVPAPDGVSLDHRHQGDPVDGAMARLAESIARELIQGDNSRLRVCENTQCRWVFKDTSRTGKRKWCSMRSCGNRAKVARHRARRRASTAIES
ncbi:MAG TPA: CGNR zinc finger domain-containing protein [Candidatus Angelobacter sp.]|jgi:predicted RNA-binding Zn ribbon-like protein|nr:CGNR zinc finger domain-containing protein [Candidatus Angelobacter sp.]